LEKSEPFALRDVPAVRSVSLLMFQIWLSRVCSISEQRQKPVACRVYKNHATILHVRCAADHILDRAAQTNTVPAQRNLPFR